MPGPTSRQRSLTLIDCVGIGINGIVGSGIFLLPEVLRQRAGAASPLGWLLVGALCTLVARTFAVAASQTEESGGPYRYAREALGPLVGFAVGWITLSSALLGYAAVARGCVEQLVQLLAPWLSPGPLLPVALTLLVGGLALLNVRGVRPSARVGVALSAAKLSGLMLFLVAGGLVVWGRPLAAPVEGTSRAHAPLQGTLAAAFAGLFALTGFEFVPVPAGEVRDPRRNVGRAMVLSVVGATLLYAAVQWVYVRAVGSAPRESAALAAAAGSLFGERARAAMGLLGVLSAIGFCSGSALVAPRYLAALADDGLLPRPLAARHPTYGTPSVAIWSLAAAVLGLALLLDFTRLADTSTVAVVAQYGTTALSVLALQRRSRSAAWAHALPLSALIGCLLLLGGVAPREWLLAGLLAVVGAGAGLVARWRRRGARATA
jgi:amino acid transporter